MKNKKVLVIIFVIVAILDIVGGIGGFLYYQNMKKNQEEEYNQAVKKYERIVEIADKINTTIDDKVKSTNDFIATNPDVRRR